MKIGMISPRLLSKQGHTVVAVKDGREVIDLIEKDDQGGFNLILMKVQMPDVDGFQAMALICERETEALHLQGGDEVRESLCPDRKARAVPMVVLASLLKSQGRKQLQSELKPWPRGPGITSRVLPRSTGVVAEDPPRRAAVIRFVPRSLFFRAKVRIPCFASASIKSITFSPNPADYDAVNAARSCSRQAVASFVGRRDDLRRSLG